LTKTERKGATCGEAGYEAYWTCDRCGRIFADENAENEIAEPVVIPATGNHDWTRENTGRKYYRNADGSYKEDPNGAFLRYDTECSICGSAGEPEYEIVHYFGDWEYPQAMDACEEETERIRTCKGHDFNGDGVVDETCNVEIRDSVPAGGHYWSPRYEFIGKTTLEAWYDVSCTTCGYIRETQQALLVDKSYKEDTVKDATCTEAGTQIMIASTVLYYDKREWEIPSLGHVFRKYKVLQAPDENTRGVEALVCERCGKTLEGSEKEIPSLSEDPLEFYTKNN
jgi:hypothetical protein